MANSLGQIRQAVTNLKNLGSPQAAMQQLMQQRTPHLAEAIDAIKQHGGDGRAAFEALAKQHCANVSAADIENMMR